MELDLSPFTGTEYWYRHSLVRNVTYTDGVKYVADTAGAYWLLDEIVFTQLAEPKVANEEFQVWKLVLAGNGSATLICEDGNYNQIYRKDLTFTDFPDPQGVTLWFTDHVILLPGEY